MVKVILSECIDEVVKFEFPALNTPKALYVYSKQGKAPKSVFAEVTGAKIGYGCFWDIGEPKRDVIWRTTNGGSSYGCYYKVVGDSLINGLNVSQIGEDYIKFIFTTSSSDYIGTSIHVKILFE